MDFKKSGLLKGFFNLFVFGFLFTIIKKTYDLLWFMVIKMFIEIARLYNLMMYGSNPNLDEKGGFYPPSWFSLNNSKTVKVVTLEFSRIQ